jgi:hypothetical protein
MSETSQNRSRMTTLTLIRGLHGLTQVLLHSFPLVDSVSWSVSLPTLRICSSGLQRIPGSITLRAEKRLRSQLMSGEPRVVRLDSGNAFDIHKRRTTHETDGTMHPTLARARRRVQAI